MPVRISAIRQRSSDWEATGQKQLEMAVKSFSSVALAMLQRYPPPNSDYVRTGRLGRSWASRNTPHGVTVYNPVGYSSYVQGPLGRSGRAGGQTAVMAGKGWTSITTAAKEAEKAAAAAANGVKMVSRNYGSV